MQCPPIPGIAQKRRKDSSYFHCGPRYWKHDTESHVLAPFLQNVLEILNEITYKYHRL